MLYDEHLPVDEDDRLSRVGALVEGRVHEATSANLTKHFHFGPSSYLRIRKRKICRLQLCSGLVTWRKVSRITVVQPIFGEKQEEEDDLTRIAVLPAGRPRELSRRGARVVDESPDDALGTGIKHFYSGQ